MAPAAFAQLTFEPSWEVPSFETTRIAVEQWMAQSQANEHQQLAVRELWAPGEESADDGMSLLDRLAESFALLDSRARELVDACEAPRRGPLPPDAAWIGNGEMSDFERSNLRLYYARWLAQQRHYDEVLDELEGISPEDVVDPAALLFYKMVAHHQLVQPDESRSALVQLLEHEDALPRRYLQMARLVGRDLAGLKDDSLDHVARRMNDVRRRLEIGRAGKQVQLVERGVLESLDQLIEKLEEQQRQQQSAAGVGSSQSSKPMEDSRLPSMKAPPMRVDQRDLGNNSEWGSLPPKERKQALQQISREFPTHYRDLIDQYFRELAEDAGSSSEN